MKKTYKTPATNVVKIQLLNMITASAEGTGRSVSGNSVSGNAQLSRQSGGWDDED
ncbi:MAG: hypothetical protein J5552_12435 [Prevotella sp.]|nr:hypothetical protein [Prevotella sp.]